MISFLFLAMFARASDWQGEYLLKQSDQESASASISNCSEKSCSFKFQSGSVESDCSASGELVIRNASKAESSQEVTADGDGPRGTCVLTFERAKNGKLSVDSKDVFKTKTDEAFGSPCNTLCGFQGARYFSVELSKVSDKAFFAPSFTCVGVALTSVEKEICTNENLAKLDRDLADKVAQLKAQQPKLMARLTTEQRQWLKARDSKCKDASVRCLEDVYGDRLRALAKLAP